MSLKEEDRRTLANLEIERASPMRRLVLFSDGDSARTVRL